MDYTKRIEEVNKSFRDRNTMMKRLLFLSDSLNFDTFFLIY